MPLQKIEKNITFVNVEIDTARMTAPQIDIQNLRIFAPLPALLNAMLQVHTLSAQLQPAYITWKTNSYTSLGTGYLYTDKTLVVKR